VALRGRLKEPVLEQQVKRMLADPRSRALVDNFATQWLKLGKIVAVKPDEYEFPSSTKTCARPSGRDPAIHQQPAHEDRSVVDLLSADYSFVNDRLARHYGILTSTATSSGESPSGRCSRRPARAGGILTATSYPNRTSPVVRGRWLLENMLGARRLHRRPTCRRSRAVWKDSRNRCASEWRCAEKPDVPPVVRMDPLGFSLENFDGLGKWRAMSDGEPIDTSASLPDGTRFEGVVGLRKLLLDHRADFVRTLTEKCWRMRWAGREATTFRRFVRSRGTRHPAITAGRRSSWGS
jgi:hypothetical protein